MNPGFARGNFIFCEIFGLELFLWYTGCGGMMIMYTEKEWMAALEAGMAAPELLYKKEYIREKGICTDSGRSLEAEAVSFLLAHLQDMKVSCRENYETVLRRASETEDEAVQEILKQKQFFRGTPVDLRVTVRNRASGEETDFFAASIDTAGDRICFFTKADADMLPLERILYLWAGKETMNREAVEKALGLPAGKFRFAAVGICREDGKETLVGNPLRQRLSALLSVFTVKLFHGWHVLPVNGGSSLPGELTRSEILALLEEDGEHPETLYMKDYINRFGLTADTREPYARVISEWLLAHREIWITAPVGKYRLTEEPTAEVSGEVPEEKAAAQDSLPPFGRLLRERIAFSEPSGDGEGKPVLLFHDGRSLPQGDYSIVRWMEEGNGTESLLGMLLRVFFHKVTLDQEMLIERLHLSPDTLFEGRIVLPEQPGRDIFLRDLPELEELMRDMGIGLVLSEYGYEAFL